LAGVAPDGAARIHWDIADPADADGTGHEEEVFRRTLAEIEDRLPALRARVRREAEAGGPG